MPNDILQLYFVKLFFSESYNVFFFLRLFFLSSPQPNDSFVLLPFSFWFTLPVKPSSCNLSMILTNQTNNSILTIPGACLVFQPCLQCQAISTLKSVVPQLVSRWRQKTMVVLVTDWILCLCSGCVWRWGSARSGAVCRPAMAGWALPALHEGGGKTGWTEQKVKPGGATNFRLNLLWIQIVNVKTLKSLMMKDAVLNRSNKRNKTTTFFGFLGPW